MQVGGEISHESYVRIKHRDSRRWLHLNQGNQFESIAASIDSIVTEIV